MKKHILKRGIAVLLSAVLMVPNSVTALASQTPETEVSGTRIDESQIPDGESIVYFGATTLSVKEDTGIYYLPVYRDGAELPEEDITIHTMDISAMYGDDYQLLGSRRKEYTSGKTILEMLMSGELSDAVEHVYDVEVATPSDYRSGTVTEVSASDAKYKISTPSDLEADEDDEETEEASDVKAVSEDEDEDDEETEADLVVSAGTASSSSKKHVATPSDLEDEDEDDEDSDEEWTLFDDAEYNATFLNSANEGRSQLAVMKEEQTGEPTRDEGSSDLSSTLTDAMMNQIVPELLPEIMYSCEQKIHFDEGQDETTVKLKIMSDSNTEGAETFSVMIVGADETRPYGAISTSVVINDSQQAEYSVLSLNQGSYIAENNKVEVVVERTGATYSLCTAVLKGTDAENGTETVYGEVVFMPGEEKKKVDLNISRETEISLCELTAAQLDDSSVSTATVYPEEALTDEDSNTLDFYSDGVQLTAATESNGSRSFNIKLGDNSKEYHVICEDGKAYGKIYDEAYDPHVEVGIYVLPADASHNGWFEYGKYEGYDTSCRYSDYQDDNKRGHMEWYNWKCWNKGNSKAVLWGNHDELNAAYYQITLPDWEQIHHKYGGQESGFYIQEGKNDWNNKTIGGEFERKRYAASVYKPRDNGYLHFEIKAIDDRADRTADTEIYLYGIVCMYKRFRINYENPDTMEFRAGKSGSSVSYVPLQFSVDCGAETGSARQRDIYANIDSNASNLVLTTKAVEINGSINKFGKISKYRLTLGVGLSTDKQVTVEYPREYLEWLNSYEPGDNASLPINKQIRESIEKNVNSNLDRIPYDKYFLKWIDSIQKGTIDDGFGNSDKSYHQTIHLVPVIDYINVPVTVQLPYGYTSVSSAAGAFSDKDLAVGDHTFHAGDKLDLSVTIKDDFKETYQVLGYEVSTDGGSKFDSITSTDELVLQPNQSYVIRPLISEKVNAVEIQFADNANRYFTLQDEILDQSELDGYPTLKNHNWLIVNPEGKTAIDKIRVTPGKAYSLNILISRAPSDRTKTYYPYIRHVAKNKVYSGQRYDFIGAQKPADNVLIIGCDTINKTELQNFIITGSAFTSLPAIRNDALGKHSNPALGYQVMMGSGQKSREDEQTHFVQNYVNIVSDSVGPKGEFKLSNITGRANSLVTMLISSGDDSQIREFKLPDKKGTFEVGVQDLSYPLLAPKITSLAYQYTDPLNNTKTDLTQNTVLLVDDTLKLTAQVSTKDRKITKVVFRSTNSAGATHDYTANANTSNPGVYEVTLPNLLKTFTNGEKMAVYIVEEAAMKDQEGKTVKREITYPLQQTGLVFYTRNELLAPKTFDVAAIVDECTDAIDIPLIGDAYGKEESGKITFNRVDWKDKKGYSLLLNLDTMVYSTFPVRDDKEMLDVVREYSSNAQKVAKGQAAKERMEIPKRGERANDVLGSALDLEEDDEEDVLQKFNDNEAIKAGSEAKADMNKKALVEFHVLLCMDLEFVYNKTLNQYSLATASVTIGGTGEISKTFYTVLYSIPCYINLAGSGNISLTLGGVCDEAKDALTAGQFGQTEGNIKQMLTGGTFMAQLDMAAQFKAQAGVGVCGILGARGYVALGLEFQAGDNNINKDKVGFVLNGKGGIGLDLLIGSFNMDIINAAKGWGSLSDKTNVSMFNSMVPITSQSLSSVEDETEDTEESEEWTDSEETENITYTAYDQGEVPDADNFAADSSSLSSVLRNIYEDELDAEDSETGTQSLTATPSQVSTDILMDNAADHTRPKLIDIGGGKEFMTFLGASADDPDASVLYYAVKSAGGKWSAPARVSDKTKLDLQASLLKKDGKVYIAWTTATSNIDLSSMQKKDVLSKLNVVMATYDISEGTMSSTLEPLTNNNYAPTGPVLVTVGDNMYCMYALIDYDKSETDADYLDYNKNYSTLAYTKIGADGKAVTFDYRNHTAYEHYIVIPNKDTNDPLVSEFDGEGIRISSTDGGTHDLLVAAYTINGDVSRATDSQTEVYLKVSDITKDAQGKETLTQYKPIQLTNQSLSETNPQLTRFDNQLYLTWIEDCDGIRIMNVTEFLSTFFAPDTGSSTLNKSIVSAVESANDDWDWYRQSAADLGMPETADSSAVKGEQTDPFTYEGSIYQELYNNKFPIDSETLGSGTKHNLTRSIQNHQLVTDGKDIYLLYTDMCEEFENTGVELFGIRYQPGYADKSSMDVADEQKVSAAEAGRATGFSEAVQITNTKEVRDEVCAVMDSNGEIHTVSNLFDQSIDDDGKMKYSANRLVYTRFESKGSVEIVKNSLKQPASLIPHDIADISLTLVNKGLYPVSGYRLDAYASKNGQEKRFFFGGTFDADLDTNETVDIDIPWSVPEDAAGTIISVEVTELGSEISSPYMSAIAIKDDEDIIIHNVDTYFGEDGKIHVSASVHNQSNTVSQPHDIEICNINQDADITAAWKEKKLGGINIKALEPGEEIEIDRAIDVDAEDFDTYEKMELELRVMNGSQELSNAFTAFVADKPIGLSVNDGAANLDMIAGESSVLKVTGYPEEISAAGLDYGSSNNAVAIVTTDGVIEAVSAGKALITAYYPQAGISKTILVTVTGGETPQPVPERKYSDDSGSSSTSSGTIYSGGTVPSYAFWAGTWKTDEKGNWYYQINNQLLKSRWACIYSSNANTNTGAAANTGSNTALNQKPYAWYRFNDTGMMMTGWFNDGDGNWYYLSTDPGSVLGRMVTGWKLINGKWYYFSEKEGSGLYGALLRNTTTPDGYKVGPDGAWIK